MSLNCPICKAEIPQERVDYLRSLNHREHDIFCVKHASNRIPKAIYSGEPGTSELIFCKQVYQDSVHTKLYDSESVKDEEDNSETTEETNNVQ